MANSSGSIRNDVMPGFGESPGTHPVCEGLPGSICSVAMSMFSRLRTFAPARLLRMMSSL